MRSLVVIRNWELCLVEMRQFLISYGFLAFSESALFCEIFFAALGLLYGVVNKGDFLLLSV